MEGPRERKIGGKTAEEWRDLGYHEKDPEKRVRLLLLRPPDRPAEPERLVPAGPRPPEAGKAEGGRRLPREGPRDGPGAHGRLVRPRPGPEGPEEVRGGGRDHSTTSSGSSRGTPTPCTRRGSRSSRSGAQPMPSRPSTVSSGSNLAMPMPGTRGASPSSTSAGPPTPSRRSGRHSGSSRGMPAPGTRRASRSWTSAGPPTPSRHSTMPSRSSRGMRRPGTRRASRSWR